MKNALNKYCLLVWALAVCLASANVRAKQVIYYGWDTPTPGAIVDAGPKLDAAPFDAVVFKHSGARQVFTKSPLPADPFEKDIQDLRAFSSHKLRNSFLRMQVNTEDGWDWTNEAHWNAFESNLRNYARLAKEGDLKGILLDPEPYGFNVWNFETQEAYSSGELTLEALEQIAYGRGQELVRILGESYPGITLFSLKMFSQVSRRLADDPSAEDIETLRRGDVFHGLWYAFANGLIDALDNSVTLIDGNEPSYYYLSADAFEAGKAEIYGKATKAFVNQENRAKFRQTVDVAHAAYVDGILNLFDSPRFVGYYLPSDAARLELLKFHMYHGLKSSDEYYWLYVEDIRWWEGENVPEGFLELVGEVKTAVAAGSELTFDLGFLPEAVAGYDSRVRYGGAITPNAPGLTFEVEGLPNSACNAFNNGSRYGCTFPADTSATVTPIAEGFTFGPASLTFGPDTKRRGRQDFLASPAP